jgi:hypothetical protein
MTPARRWLRHKGYDWDDALLFVVVVLGLAVAAWGIVTI